MPLLSRLLRRHPEDREVVFWEGVGEDLDKKEVWAVWDQAPHVPSFEGSVPSQIVTKQACLDMLKSRTSRWTVMGAAPLTLTSFRGGMPSSWASTLGEIGL